MKENWRLSFMVPEGAFSLTHIIQLKRMELFPFVFFFFLPKDYKFWSRLFSFSSWLQKPFMNRSLSDIRIFQRTLINWEGRDFYSAPGFGYQLANSRIRREICCAHLFGWEVSKSLGNLSHLRRCLTETKKGRIKDNIFHSSKVKDEENNKGKIVHLHVLSRCCHAELMKLRA